MQDRAMSWPNAPVPADEPPGSESGSGGKTGYDQTVPPQPKPQPKPKPKDD